MNGTTIGIYRKMLNGIILMANAKETFDENNIRVAETLFNRDKLLAVHYMLGNAVILKDENNKIRVLRKNQVEDITVANVLSIKNLKLLEDTNDQAKYWLTVFEAALNIRERYFDIKLGRELFQNSFNIENDPDFKLPLTPEY